MPKRHSTKSRFFTTTGLILATAVFVSVVTLWATKLHEQRIGAEGTSTEPTLLYVQTAHSGTLSAETADGKRILTLNNVSPTTVYFSEKPDRETGHESTAAFIAEWNSGEDSFEANPPNAALDIIDDDSQSIVIVELMGAKYDASTQTLEYEILILDDETNGTIPESFDEAALFIDSTFKKYHCGCEPAAGERGCWCRYDYYLGKGKTKEFRGYCTSDSDIEPTNLNVSGKGMNTTCTADVMWKPYVTRSCTNWSVFTKDKLTLTVHCRKYVPL